MSKKLYFCESCDKTGKNTEALGTEYFTKENLDYRKGYIYEKSCKGNTSVCPYCNNELKIAEISEEDFVVLGNTSNDNRQLLDAMVDLHKKDVIEYELKMSQFRNQYEQSQREEKQEKESGNQVKCPKCGCTDIQIVPHKWSLLTGFLTNKTDRVCVNCKHKF
ncbi:hypothetical protein [Lacrimispora indolis]|uniref:hypothetical protein n=1 Tax=Lacrimispora indolis TaxID=69825 RepID=UPI000462AD2A|nr:hypothetical protein [[Clostridium] methoxybenzovorans]